MVLCANARAAETPETTKRFENTNDQFAITLTTSWKELTPTEAAELVGETGQSDTVVYGYELILPEGAPTNSEAYVVVHVDKDDRVPERYIAGLQHDMMRRRTVLQRLAAEGVEEKDFLDSSFDSSRLLLRVSASRTDEEAGRIRFLQGVFFTDTGTITVTCGTAAQNYKALAKTFAAALDTFHIDPSLKYRIRQEERVAARESGTKRVRFRFGFIFVIAGLGLAIARYFANRVNSDDI